MEPDTRRHNMRLAWEPVEDVEITVDPVQIQQVLVNLLRNAYEAMPTINRPSGVW